MIAGLILFGCVVVTAGLVALAGELDTDTLFISAFLAAAATLIVAVIVIIIAVAVPMDRGSCNRYSAATGRTVAFHRWSYFSWDCMVRTPDGWFPRDEIRSIDIVDGTS
jgi:cbb3-type cytochrome oxidase subunit 1